MSPSVARILRLYSRDLIPSVADRIDKTMKSRFQRWLKRYWYSLSHKERYRFKLRMIKRLPVKGDFLKVVKSAGFVVDKKYVKN